METTTPEQSSETKPYSVLFVCLGNICRSPAAEGVFRDIVKKRGLDSKFNIDSAGTIDYHEGNMADPRMRSAAKRRGIEITSLSRPIKASDFREFDLILAMDEQNKEDILKAYNVWKARGNFPPDADKKVKLMCSYCKKHNDKFVPDPYYGGAQGFEKVLDLLEDACESLLDITVPIAFFMLFRKSRFEQDNNESTSSSSLSLPSPPTSLSRKRKYHVFPSFHGADVRNTFLSHILESFKRKGIDTFIDNAILRSKPIGPELLKAIKGSKIAIVLLSKNYASSSWCLDELAEIMKCREELGKIVLTIFYEVEPTEVKKLTGDFGKAFRKTCKGKTKERTGIWRKALEDVATIAGYHFNRRVNEAAMIEKLATEISNMLNNTTPSRDFDSLVGMGNHMERLEPLLRLDLDDEVRIIGIWGPPGIGKTTIGRFMLDQFSSKFERSAIMVDIRRSYPFPISCGDEQSAMLQLQTQMLSQMMNQKDIKISHLGMAQEWLKEKKVFLVLDEVDRLGQVNALAKETRWFGPGSRIIIITEDLRVLKALKINHFYAVKFPTSDEALQIFCMHAFGHKHPDDGFDELAREVACLAGELPLGLKILGSTLKGKSKPEWERKLPRLKTKLNGEIESIMKFSYDALDDEENKYLFLYIACFFSDKFLYPRNVEEILSKKFSDVRQGLEVLAEKALISMEYGLIHMHHLLQQFGRETSRKQFVQHGLREHYLLVGARDICEELSNDTTDNRHFIGINLDLSKTEEELYISQKAIERMSDLEIIRIDGKEDLSQPERLDLLLHHSQKIRFLDWSYFPNTCLPFTFNPEFLFRLCMRSSKLHKLWEGATQLKNLKWMDLSYSEDLKELPDLSTATTLEELDLQGCSSLVELPSSIGNATNLRELNLSECSKLVKIPSSIENLTNLQKLNLVDCLNLVELPSIENATKLEELELANCSRLVKLPSFINATKLDLLNLSNCSSLLELPPSIGTATNLKKLYVSGCSSLVNLPSSIGDLTNLQDLDLSNCSNLVELPSSIGNLQLLSYLRMRGCSKLEALPTNINLESLDLLDLTDCSQLKSFPEISTNIEDLSLTGTAIKEVPLSILSWSRLSNFLMSYFESLKEFPHALDIITGMQLNEDIQEVPPCVKGMPRLRVLRLHNCNHLVSLPQFSDSLWNIDAGNCQSLERLDCSFNNPKISLKFSNCFKLNQEARDLIMHTSTSRYAVLPSTQVPACFNHRATAEGSLTIKLNESSLPKSLRFKACIMLVDINEEAVDEFDLLYVYNKIMNKQNDLEVRCTTRGQIIDQVLTEHIYTFEVETEEVTSTELLFEFTTYNNDKWKVGECGVYQILEVQR
ncbi:probable disease resistance protein RPP1 [Capsella rubella]|nr:probable disease resistance protein RPP1 [Capsella rubella]